MQGGQMSLSLSVAGFMGPGGTFAADCCQQHHILFATWHMLRLRYLLGGFMCVLQVRHVWSGPKSSSNQQLLSLCMRRWRQPEAPAHTGAAVADSAVPCCVISRSFAFACVSPQVAQVAAVSGAVCQLVRRGRSWRMLRPRLCCHRSYWPRRR